MALKTLTDEELEQVMAEARMGRLFGIPLKNWKTTSCLSCAVSILYRKRTRQPCYCEDCAEELGRDQFGRPPR